jgi:hypothetical protein
LRPEIDLQLLRDSLVELEETTYFSGKLHQFTKKLASAISHALSERERYDHKVIAGLAEQVRLAHRYLEGSTTKEAPYEMEYCLKTALPHWIKRESLITTALTAGQDFHFSPADPWGYVKNTITGFDTLGFDPLLVLIGVPRLYVHKPLYCIPLYHELGHFADVTLGITKYSFLIQPPSGAIHPQAEKSHRLEYFADLFAACYVGEASIATLETIAPNNPHSMTHPSTASRAALVRDFLAGIGNPTVDLFQTCLNNLGVPSLAVMFDAPNLGKMDDLKPHSIQSERELHGIFLSGWKYLEAALDSRNPPWSKSMSDGDIERIINDLIEKSLRKRSVRERWGNGATV